MSDPRLVKLAQTLINYSLDLKSGEWVWLVIQQGAEQLAEEVYRAIIKAGAFATVQYVNEAFEEIFYQEAQPHQLTWVSPAAEMLSHQVDARILLRAAKNTRYLSGIDVERQQTRAKAMGPLNDIRMQRTAETHYRWTTTNAPCDALAQEANMSLSDYEDFIYAATYADQDDPIAAWQRVRDQQAKYIDWLQGKDIITVKSPHADLQLSVKNRIFINSCGTANMPGSEVFTGPVEDSANGWVEFNYPAIRDGREVEGVRLEFKDGKVVNATAKKNQGYLLSQLETDQGARYLGEFAIGTNYGIKKFTKNILYDEKLGGSFHIALGRGYQQTGSLNKSSIHWDMICDMRTDSEIAADGEVFYKDGHFLI